MIEQKPKCPKCGSGNVVPIRYGYPGAEMWSDYEAGKIDLGGCVISGDGDDPVWRCRHCRHAWPTENR